MFEPRLTIPRATVIADPEINQTNNGSQYIRVRIAVNPGYKDKTGNWQDGTPQYFTLNSFQNRNISAWGQLHKGDKVMVSGNLSLHQWQPKDGGPTRSDMRIELADIARLVEAPKTKVEPAPAAAPADPYADDWSDVF